MNIIELFTPEEIEKYGLIYEPDETKCKTMSTKVHYGSFDVDENGVLHGPYTPKFGEEYSEENYKKHIAEMCYFKCVHSFFV
jgi:hypothetical protein